ncbi:Basic-leucine zipper domain [Macleaya cordata]|uniref:Basic-leucine zipper domain n=1 Tax=Macleaya cordata TaxID=56857 RepID=A0A200R8M2_MACCD|nr:Basic-leucine zipper domain [Macleaya cordata]
MEPQYNETQTGKPFSGPFPSRIDIEQMPETPQRGSHHRRAQSETFFRFPDDILFDTDVDFNLSGIDIPSMSEENDDSRGNNSGFPMPVDSGKSDESNGGEKFMGNVAGTTNHFRSLSVGAEFFEGLGFQPSPVVGGGGGGGGEVEKFGGKGGVQERRMHRHSNSMDGSSSSFEAESMEYAKKAMGPDRLAELALMDPKRAKRILANRQSAARSKERKIRYTSELERKVQTLQTEATTLSAQVTLLQRDTTGLTNENKELKLRLQAMEQQAHLRDALNETLRDEVQRLKISTGQVQSVHGNSYNRGQPPPFFSHSQPMRHFGIPQTQQQLLQVSQSSSNNQASGGQPQHGNMDFHQRV